MKGHLDRRTVEPEFFADAILEESFPAEVE